MATRITEHLADAVPPSLASRMIANKEPKDTAVVGNKSSHVQDAGLYLRGTERTHTRFRRARMWPRDRQAMRCLSIAGRALQILPRHKSRTEPSWSPESCCMSSGSHHQGHTRARAG
eukprot:1632098-Prymnesium_polylepis.4